jgi:hypothetical protein
MTLLNHGSPSATSTATPRVITEQQIANRRRRQRASGVMISIRSGEELRAARLAAAARFEAIAAPYVPAGWTVIYRKSLSGCCNHTTRTIAAPRPRTRKALYIFLHECAHAELHPPPKKLPRHVEEMEAEKWAHAKMRQHGISVPRAMTVRAKRYVARKIKQAMRRGAKTIDARARAFARTSD